jgi:hypothetical protein
MIRRWIRIAAIITALSACGCFPGVAWWPDSSGFIYTEKRGSRLLSFDLKTKKSRVLTSDAGTTVMPALRPDGERIAVARCEDRNNSPYRLQVRILDREGKEVKRSRWYERTRPPDNGFKIRLEWVHLYWATNDRILLLADRLYLYDVREDRFRDLGDHKPAYWGTMPPVRPDRKGFLAIRDEWEFRDASFVDWDGKAAALAGKIAMGDEPRHVGLLGWDRDVAILTHRGVLYEADTEAKTLRPSKRKPMERLDSEGWPLAYHRFPGGAVALCVFAREKGTGKEKRTEFTAEVHDLGTRKRTALTKPDDAIPMLFPSPDAKMVALMVGTGRKVNDPKRL